MAGEITAVAAALEAQGETIDDEAVDLFAGMGLPENQDIEMLRRRAGPGRPLGARNRRTEQTVARLLAWRRDPRDVLLEIAEAPIDVLMATLGCTALEALQEKRHAAVGVLPYVAQKQAVEVNVSGIKPVHMHFTMGGAAAADSHAGSMAARLLNIIENQELSDSEGETVEQPPVEQDR